MDIETITTDESRLYDLFSERPTQSRNLSIEEFALLCPITAGPKKGQLFRFSDAPYLKEPMSLLNPASPIQQVICMWSAQVGKSVLGQIITAYYAKEVPSEMIYATADLASARKVVDRRLQPMFEAVGVEFKSHTENRRSKKTGDLAVSKEFAGGCLDIVTANSTAALAAETKRLGIGDEIDKWKKTIGSEGTPWSQLWARLKAWKDEKKALAISTPTDESTSLIYNLFLTGDQREWWVPCPLCGEYQILEVRNRNGYGLDYDTKRGKIVEKSILYICIKCGKSFREKNNRKIQQAGEWRTPNEVEPMNRFTASFHLHSLNSMFESWLEIASAYEKGLEDPIARKDYENLVAGLPSKEKGARIESKAVMQNRGEYRRGTVPDGVIYLTFGADVQAGAERWQEFDEVELQDEVEKAKRAGDIHEKKFPRIELEVFGSGPSYRGWSIDYQVLYGKTDNAYSGAFERLYQFGLDLKDKNGGFGYKRADGTFFPIVLSLIDSGHNASTVYGFTSRWGLTYPCKGDRIIAVKGQKNIELHQSNFLKWKRSQVDGGLTTLYTISTKLYKKQLYNLLMIKRTNEEIQAPGFQDFPREYKSRYFDGLTAEEKLSNGEYDNRGRYNEPIDARVYSMTAADIYLQQEAERWKQWYKTEHKWNDRQLETISRRWVVEQLAKKMGIDERYLITKSKVA